MTTKTTKKRRVALIVISSIIAIALIYIVAMTFYNRVSIDHGEWAYRGGTEAFNTTKSIKIFFTPTNERRGSNGDYHVTGEVALISSGNKAVIVPLNIFGEYNISLSNKIVFSKGLMNTNGDSEEYTVEYGGFPRDFDSLEFTDDMGNVLDIKLEALWR